MEFIRVNGQLIRVDGEIIGESDNDTTALKEEVEQRDVKDPEWRWPTHEKWFSMLEGKWHTRETTKLANNKRLLDGMQCPFEVTTQIDQDSGDTSEVFVKLRSPHLISIVRTHMPHMVETICCEEPNIDAKVLFIIWPTLRDELKAAQDEESSFDEAWKGLQNDDEKPDSLPNGSNAANGEEKALAHLHLKHLLRFLDEHFKDTSTKFTWMKQEGLVSYSMLWAFLTPGIEVRRLCELSGQACSAILDEGKYQHHRWNPEENCFRIKLKVMDYNGKSYRKSTMVYKIKEFDGEVAFISLTVCPWSFFSSQERCNMVRHLQQRGQLFYDYVVKEPFRFMHFRGALGHFVRNVRGCFELRRVNADGRVMVDLLSLARANPDWPLGNAQPPTELLRGVEMQGTDAVEDQKKPTEKELEYAPAVVFGFSFSLKKWGCFDVEGLRDITFEDKAYEQLVMRSTQQKEMLRAIVTTHLSKKSESRGVDVVAQKGEGCVVLCYGPPGTGKTLTAETLAETLHRPLWAISAFELGEEAGELEQHLSNVLSTALRWRAVVLLDEADGYLERRGFNVDIKRNLMTGVFLRLLEYYSGVLFLTTNRVRAFDDAFLSRISLCISYPALDNQRRMLIWQTLLARAGLAAATEANLNSLVQCGQPLNGREIRNIIALAHTWAHSRAQPICFDDVHAALELVIAGSKKLLRDVESDAALP